MSQETGREQPMSPKEREAYFREHPDEITAELIAGLSEKDREVFVDRLLNNFYTYTPGGMHRRWGSGVKGVKLRLDSRPIRSAQRPENMSERKFRETNRQFFEAVDRALDSQGLSRDEIATINGRLLKLGEKLNREQDAAERKKIYDELVPLRHSLNEKILLAYKELRAEYSHHDLTA